MRFLISSTLLLAARLVIAQQLHQVNTSIVNTTNTTGGIQEAINAANFFLGTEVHLPPGDYVLYAGIRLSSGGITIRGSGSGNTRLFFDVPDETDWISTSYGVSGFRLEDIALHGPTDDNLRAVNASGCAFRGHQNTYLTIRNVTIEAAPNGLCLPDVTIGLIEWVSIRNVAPGTGIAVDINGNNTNALSLEHIVIDNPAGPAPFAGIHIGSAAEVYIRNSQIMRAGYGILAKPTKPTDVISLLVVSDTTLDHCQWDGIAIIPSAGSVMRSKWTNIWTAGGAMSGVNIDPSGSGQVQNATFDGLTSFSNAGHGVVVAAASYVAISNSSISHNGIDGRSKTGVFWYSGSHYSLVNSFLGNAAEIGPETQDYGLLIDSPVTHVRVIGNEFSGNLKLPIADLSPTRHKIIQFNLGVDVN